MTSKVVLAALFLFAAFTGSARAAQTVVLRWTDSQFSGPVAEAAQQAAEQALTERAALTLKPLPADFELQKGCAQEKACVAQLAKREGVDHVLLLRGRQTGPRYWVDGVWWEASSERLRVRLERDMPEAAEAARSVVEALIPAYARRGFAGLHVDVPAGVTVKVDGRAVGTAPFDAPLVVPSGRRSIDLRTVSGHSVLTNVTLQEGERVPVGLTELTPTAGGRGRRNISGLRWTSYGLWAAGALSIAGSLVAGKLSRDAESQLQACTPTNRSACTSAADARGLAARMDRYSGRANLLLGVGGGLTLAGVGLFTWTALSPGPDAPGAPSASGSNGGVP